MRLDSVQSMYGMTILLNHVNCLLVLSQHGEKVYRMAVISGQNGFAPRAASAEAHTRCFAPVQRSFRPYRVFRLV